MNSEGEGFIIEGLENDYYISTPENDKIKEKYMGLEKVIYTSGDLTDISSSNIKEEIFEKFDRLKGM